MTTTENTMHPSFGEAFKVWLKIGCINFGGPAGQIALMHRIVVDEKKWVDEARFLHALNFCMLLPGPEAQKLATYLGWLLHGVRGGLAAGILFVLPGAFVMLGLSLLYALGRGVSADRRRAVRHQGRRAGDRGRGADPHRQARAQDRRCCSRLAAAAFVGIFFLALPFPLIVAAAALVGYLVARQAPAQLGLAAKAESVPPPAQGPLAAIRHRIAGRTAGVVGAGRARGAGLRSAACAGRASACFSPSSRW